jgi:hypothetical protein
MTIAEEALQEIVSLRAELAELKAQMARRNDRMVEALNLLHSAGFGLKPDGVTFTEMVSEAVHELERLRQPRQDWVAVAKELETLRAANIALQVERDQLLGTIDAVDGKSGLMLSLQASQRDAMERANRYASRIGLIEQVMAGHGCFPEKGLSLDQGIDKFVGQLQKQRDLLEELLSQRQTALVEAQKSAAAWEIQAQDLRDKLIEVTQQRDKLQAVQDALYRMATA